MRAVLLAKATETSRADFRVSSLVPQFLLALSCRARRITGPEGIPLFDEQGRPAIGEVSDRVRLWDAGTELNDAPGAGEHQAPREKAANTGPSENGVVRLVGDGFVYPEVPEVLRITINGK